VVLFSVAVPDYVEEFLAYFLKVVYFLVWNFW
jgi:hypothetical protein